MGRAIGTVECETDAIAVEITVSFEAAVFVGFVLMRAVLIVGFEVIHILLAVWTAFEWVIAATMVFETVDRIALSCSVLTKLESLKWGAAGCNIIGIATVDVERACFAGAAKIHCVTSKIALIKCRRDGECCGYLIWRRRSIWDWRMASNTRRYCCDCSRDERMPWSIKYDKITL